LFKLPVLSILLAVISCLVYFFLVVYIICMCLVSSLVSLNCSCLNCLVFAAVLVIVVNFILCF
jgi:hypothetical protein